MVTSIENLRVHEKAQLFLQNKFGLRMSEQTWIGLRNFLHDKQLTVILFIINRHLHIDIFTAESSSDLDGMELGQFYLVWSYRILTLIPTLSLGATLSGYAESSRTAEDLLNKTKIHWGSLETPAIATRRAEQKKAKENANKGKENTNVNSTVDAGAGVSEGGEKSKLGGRVKRPRSGLEENVKVEGGGSDVAAAMGQKSTTAIDDFNQDFLEIPDEDTTIRMEIHPGCPDPSYPLQVPLP